MLKPFKQDPFRYVVVFLVGTALGAIASLILCFIGDLASNHSERFQAQKVNLFFSVTILGGFIGMGTVAIDEQLQLRRQPSEPPQTLPSLDIPDFFSTSHDRTRPDTTGHDDEESDSL